MAHQIIWTTLPAGIRGNRVKISVVVSPRLDVALGSQWLESYPDFTLWPARLAGITFTLQLRSLDALTSGPDLVSEPLSPITAVDEQVWRTVFDGQTKVEPYVDDSVAARVSATMRLASYDAAIVQSALLTATFYELSTVREAARLKPNDLSVNPIVARLAALGQGAISVDSLDPLVTAFKGLEQFHARPDDSAVLAGSSEEQQLDFHSVISAFREHNTLIRQLGLVLDFELDLALLQPAGPVGVLRLLPSGGDFVQPVTHITPWTAFDLNRAVGNTGLGIFHPRHSDGGYSPEWGGFRAMDDATVKLAHADGDALGMRLAVVGRQLHASRTDDVGDYTRRTEPPTQLDALRQVGIGAIDLPVLVGQSSGGELPVIADFRRALGRQETLEAAVRFSPNTPASAVSERSTADGLVLYAGDGLVRGYRVNVLDPQKGIWRSLCERQVSYAFVAGPLAGTTRDVTDEGETSRVASRQPKDGEEITKLSPYLWLWNGWSLVVPRPARAVADDGRTIDVDGRDRSQRNVVIRATVPDGSLAKRRLGQRYDFFTRTVDLAGNSWTTGEAVLLLGHLSQIRLVTSASNPRLDPVSAPVIVPAHRWLEGEKGTTMVIRMMDDARPTRSIRHVAPPQVSFDMLDAHGVLDELSDDRAYDVLFASQSQFPESDADLESLQSLRSTNGRLNVPYLPDPVATSATLFDVGSVQNAATVSFQAGRRPGPNAANALARTFRLILQPARSKDEPSLEQDRDRIVVRIPPGRQVTAKLACSLTEKDARQFWPFDARGLEEITRLSSALGNAIRVSSEAQSRLLAQFKGGREDVLTPPREITFVHATQRPVEPPLFGSGPSVTRILGSLTGELVDPDFRIDIASTGRLDVDCQWEDVVDVPGTPQWNTIQRHIKAFGYDIATSDTRPLRPESWQSVETVQGNSAIKQERREQTLRRPGPTAHSLEDGKFHLVTYVASAVSRFGDFMPEEVRTTPGALARVGRSAPVIVRNTLPPDIPVVDYIVPTFAVRETRGMRQHEGGGLRLYLRRGWFSSGNGEKLSVIVYPDDLGAQPAALDEFVTRWGFNPRKLGNRTTPRVLLDDFRNYADSLGAITVMLSSTPAAETDPTSGPPSPPLTATVGLALYDVNLDAENDRLYADIVIDPGRAYFPMVRLALARYQHHSVGGAHISPVVLTHFTQLTPGRGVTVKRASAGCQVDISGSSYLDTQFGKMTSVIEVHLERRRSTWGGDYVWEHVAGSDTSLASRRIGSAEFVWSGIVPAPGGDRFFDGLRLVILEFEMFHADAPNRSLDPGARTSILQRLVFSDCVYF